MRKKAISLLLVLALTFSVLSLAASARSSTAKPSLSFNGTTAYCSASYVGESPRDTIRLTMTLRENGTIVAGWNTSGTGSATMSKTYSATSGASYTLTLSYTINGVSQPSVLASAKCP